MSTALIAPRSDQDESVRVVFAELIGQQQFDRWFRGKTRFALFEGELVVETTSPFLSKWLQQQFQVELLRAAESVLGPSARIRFAIGAQAAESAMPQGPSESQQALIAARPRPPALRPDRSPVDEAAATALPSRSAARRFAELHDFVAGPCNELALAAVRQVCNQPDGEGGPLFLYGPVGTGKTHLAEGIQRHLRRTHRELQSIFLTSEQFTNCFTLAYRDHTLPAFRQKFRTVDVLLVDDIDFLEGKRAVQEEFLHTFQQLESAGKLIVACGDRHPRLLGKISDELRSRFLSGMVCRLEAPGLETRERIVTRKAQRIEAEFSPEALRYVAQRFPGNVRELEGALHCLKVYSRMTGKRVGVTAAREVLADLERDCLRVVRMADIERVVCELFGVEAPDLRSASRARSVSEPRMLAMYLARRHTRSAYSEIGRHFGGRNHATVIAAERKVADWLKQGRPVRVNSRTWAPGDILETLEQQLQAG
jgi:chromosomal replication initiator protein